MSGGMPTTLVRGGKIDPYRSVQMGYNPNYSAGSYNPNYSIGTYNPNYSAGTYNPNYIPSADVPMSLGNSPFINRLSMLGLVRRR